MSAPLKKTFVIRIFAINHHVILFSNKRFSNITNKKSTSSDCEENLTLRAQKRKRALEYYEKRYNIKTDPCNSNTELSNKTIYYIENGLRKVYPYHYTFKSFVKGKWLGRTILDVYQTYCRHDGVNPVELIERGNVTVNGQKVSVDFVLRENMRIEYNYHRHETPVLNEPIEVIEDTDELLVINKPPSIPVHPCGSYRHNSLLRILENEFGYYNLRSLYRLDRLTSGVFIFMKTTPVARKLIKQLEGMELYKEYVCRVDGKFPDGDVVCNEPLSSLCSKLPVQRVHPEGKTSSTTFTRLSYSGKTSVVKCVPHTGRTHQIRVHLQFLGFPICNDYQYKRTAFGPSKGKGGITEYTLEEVEANILRETSIWRWIKGDNPKYYQTFGHKSGQNSCINLTYSENKENSADVTYNSGHRIRKSNDAVEEAMNMTESYNLKENVYNFKNLTQVSNHPHERVSFDNSSEKILNVSNYAAGKTYLQNNCDKYKYRHVSDVTEDSIISQSNGKTDRTQSFEPLPEEYSGADKSRISAPNVTDPEVVDSKIHVHEFCEDCMYIFHDPKPEDLFLYLHAVRYKGPDWEYSTPLPYWAAEDFDKQGNT